jgi:hypothetical protein
VICGVHLIVIAALNALLGCSRCGAAKIRIARDGDVSRREPV